MSRKLSKKKKAEVGIDRQQPQQVLINEAAQPERLVKGKSNSGAAKLQLKMKKAAEKFGILVADFWISEYEPNTRNLSYMARANKVFGPRVYCTPSDAVLFRLGREWVRLTAEYVAAEAFGSLPSATKYADSFLTLARMICKVRGQVGWVLPRLGKGVR